MRRVALLPLTSALDSREHRSGRLILGSTRRWRTPACLRW